MLDAMLVVVIIDFVEIGINQSGGGRGGRSSVQFNIYGSHRCVIIHITREKIQQDQLGYFYHKIMVITLWCKILW